MQHLNRIGLSGFRAAVVGLSLASVPFAADANFWDQGLNNPKFRTDYAATNEGTAANPLTLVSPCIYPSGDPLEIGGTCNLTKTTFPTSNSFSLNGAQSNQPRWTLVMNNEIWSRSKSGPPDQSLPRSLPGYGVMGFDAFTASADGETFNRAHLVLNNTFNSTALHDDGAWSIPFLGVSADYRAGNYSYPGALNSQYGNNAVYFTSALWDLYPPAYDAQQGAYLGALYKQIWIFAEWGGKPRGIFLTLYNFNVSFSYPQGDPLRPSNLPFSRFHWAWPIQESFFYPGGDLVFGEIDAIDQACGGVLGQAQRLTYAGEQRTYLIDLQTIFRCVSNLGGFDTPMPTAQVVPILGVGWANELTGPGTALWTSVHNMHMMRYTVPSSDKSTGSKSAEVWPDGFSDDSGPLPAPGERALEVHQALTESCKEDRACAAQNRAWILSGRRPVVSPDARYPFHSLQAVRDFAGSRGK